MGQTSTGSGVLEHPASSAHRNLLRAQEAAMAAAEFRRTVAAQSPAGGWRHIAEVLCARSAGPSSLTLLMLLRAVNGVGRHRAREVLDILGLDADARFGDLTDEQRRALARCALKLSAAASDRRRMPKPGSSLDQCSARSIAQRGAGRELREQIAALDKASGVIALAHLIRARDQRLEHQRVSLVIQSVRRFGERAAREITSYAGVSGMKFRELSEEQRTRLVEGMLRWSNIPQITLVIAPQPTRQEVAA